MVRNSPAFQFDVLTISDVVWKMHKWIDVAPAATPILLCGANILRRSRPLNVSTAFMLLPYVTWLENGIS